MDNEHKFQYKLAFFVFFLTLIGAVVSGCVVSYLTTDKNPTIMIYPSGINSAPNYTFTISNLKDNPAHHIILSYNFEFEENKPKQFIGSISFLSKGATSLSLDLTKVQQRVIEISEREFSNTSLNNYQSFEIYVGDGMKYGSTQNPYQNMFNLRIFAECTNCKEGDILIYYPIISFTPQIRCQHLNVEKDLKNFSCDVMGYRINTPY